MSDHLRIAFFVSVALEKSARTPYGRNNRKAWVTALNHRVEAPRSLHDMARDGLGAEDICIILAARRVPFSIEGVWEVVKQETP